MTSKSTLRAIACTLAAFVWNPHDVSAASGFSVSRSQETAIWSGMSAREVEQRLGRPAQAVRYANAPGPVWTYNVIDPLFGRTQFDVEFGADERVLSAGEQVIGGTCGR